jgi:hypothetical protein
VNARTFPFPYIVSTSMFARDLLAEVLHEIPSPTVPGWQRYSNEHEAKYEGPLSLWGPATCEYFDQLEGLIPDFEVVFGLPELSMETAGGGYHLIPPGGYLNVHTDFSVSPDTDMYRRVNVLTYLNHSWGPDDGGYLELWADNGYAARFAPEFGTTVAFVTSSSSWHGHPTPTRRWRKSVAGYLFTADPPPDFVEQGTTWHPNGGQS